METNNNEVKSSGRDVIGVRVYPALKDDLAIEAGEANMSVSALCEHYLINRHAATDELEQLRKQVTEQQAEIESLKQQLMVNSDSTDNEFFPLLTT